MPHSPILIVGAGPSGLGVHIMLLQAGIPARDILHIDRDGVGASFTHWPAQMRFISPSMTTNGWGMSDLNAIHYDTSPAYTLQTEHPSGREYQRYLQAVASNYGIKVTKGTVSSLTTSTGGFLVDLGGRTTTADRVIWAAGEYGYPKTGLFPGSDLCVHNSSVRDWTDMKGGEYHVIGGYESGIDAAYHLIKNGKQVTVYDSSHPWRSDSPDPSVSLSSYTQDRYRQISEIARFTARGGVRVTSVTKNGSTYIITLSTGESIPSATAPILATGFAGSLTLIRDQFHLRPDGYVTLDRYDQSTKTPGLYVVGPSLRHDEVIFCFIYKFRQRFGVVAAHIARKMGYKTDLKQKLRKHNWILEDWSCCGSSCQC